MKLWLSSAVIIKPVLRYVGTWLEVLGTAEICTWWTASPKFPWFHQVKRGLITWWSAPPLTLLGMTVTERGNWSVELAGGKDILLSAGMNEWSQTRQWWCCCKSVLSVVGNKSISVCPQKTNFWIQRVTLGITWISSALGTYLSQWFMHGMRKCFLPTTLLRGLFLWVMCGTLVIIALF